MWDFIVAATMILGGILIGYGIADFIYTHEEKTKCPIIEEIDKDHCIAMMKEYRSCQQESFVDCNYMGQAAKKSCGVH